MASRLLRDPGALGLVVLVMLAYAGLSEAAGGALRIDGVMRPFGIDVLPDWRELLLRRRALTQFEPVATLRAPGLIWFIAPMSLAAASAIGLMLGLQLALIGLARRCARACGRSGVGGALAGLAALLSGSAGCAPWLFLALGLPLTSALATMLAVLLPLAVLALAAGLVLAFRLAGRACASSP